MGLNIVFLGLMRNIAQELAKIIDLPGHAFVSFGMALGRPDPNRAHSHHMASSPTKQLTSLSIQTSYKTPSGTNIVCNFRLS